MAGAFAVFLIGTAVAGALFFKIIRLESSLEYWQRTAKNLQEQVTARQQIDDQYRAAAQRLTHEAYQAMLNSKGGNDGLH